jgi:sugar-specific transcriptional regulator TrmB
MIEQQSKELLKQLGLTEYEAKAYLSLVRFGKCDAEKISSTGNIPLPRVYDTMNALAERGLISISRTRPKLFEVVNVKSFFDILKNDERRKTEEKIKSIDDISSQFLKLISSFPTEKVVTNEDDVSLTFIKRGINIGDVWDQIQKETKKEFLVFAGDLSWINSRTKYIRELTKKGVKYRILWFKCIKETMPSVKKALKSGAELRCCNDDSNDLRGIISDDEKIYLIQKAIKLGTVTGNIKEGTPWSESFADYTGIMLKSRLISKIFRDYFYLLWEKSMTADNFLKKFKKR